MISFEKMERQEFRYRFAYRLRTTLFNHLRLVKIASLILMVFMISEIYFYPIAKLFRPMGEHMFLLTTESRYLLNFTPIASLEDDVTRATQPMTQSLELTTTQPSSSTKQSLKMDSSYERYKLVEKYEKDILLDVNPPFKRILFWNDYWGIPDFRLGVGRDAFSKWGCPVWQCETSTNRSDVQNYDAVIFHMRGSWKPNDLPQNRSSQQRYVFWILESAEWTEYLDTKPLGSFFNWTLTYRWDSDMVMPYGYVRPTGNVPLHPSDAQMKELLSNQKVNYAIGKTKMAAWMVSNCGSRSSRNEMVNIIKKYIQVDVYGACGTMSCPKEAGVDNSSEDCRDMVGKTYKFYMSLENSLCRDYISEKFFGMLHRPIIPIVYGLHDHYDKIAPPHSFINAAKFENMRELADYLILLDKNDTLYNEYFWWKPHFESRYKQKDVNIGMCHLCASLHNKTMPPKTYPNLTAWWDNQSFCNSSPPIS